MYYIVEITSQGIETFLEGFEDAGEAWDTVSRLRCEGPATAPQGALQGSLALQGDMAVRPCRLVCFS
jgi:hypothetical protein